MIWTVLFVVAVMVLGCVLFSVHDWGRPSGNRGRCTRMRRVSGQGELRGVPSTTRTGGADTRRSHSKHGIVHGKYLPPAYLQDRPAVGVGAEVFEGHPVLSPEEFQDMVERD